MQIGTATNWVSVSAGVQFSLAINNKGELYSWGRNTDGQLGIGNNTTQLEPVRVGTETNWVSISTGGAYTVTPTYVGSSFAINNKGELWAWGFNGNGQLGIGNTTNQNKPVRVGTQSNWVAVSSWGLHSGAINSLGELYMWGDNSYNQVGDGTTTQRNSPVKIGTATNWVAVSAGAFHTLALNETGEIWTWGFNGNGQLGIGGTTNQNKPVRVGDQSNWVSISAGGSYWDSGSVIYRFGHSLAINESGELWTWGSNGNGQLGDGTITYRYSPVKIDNQTNWVTIEAGGWHSFAINESGEILAWGNNENGRLGIGDATTQNISSPTLILGLIVGKDVSSPNSGNGYTVSAPSKTYLIFPNESYTFTITLHEGYTAPSVKLNITKGKLNYSGTKGNVWFFTVTNVMDTITSNDFEVSVFRN